MSDDTGKSRRKQTRQVDSLIDDVIAEAAADIAEDNAIDEYEVSIGGIQVEQVESDEPKPLKFIGVEPTGNSDKANRVKMFGTNDSMKFTPWKGRDMWSCTICGWSTFEKKRARRHCCE